MEKQFSELELNIKALEAMGLKVKNNPLQLSNVINEKSYFQLKDLDLKTGQVAFYFSAFNMKDSDGDIVLPGAFTKTIKENRDRIKHLYNHNKTQSPGVIKELNQDSHGAWAVSQLYKSPHTLGQNVLIEYQDGGITEHSMGYKATIEKYDQKSDANLISEIYLAEASSLTAWGANQWTPTRGVKHALNIESITKFFDLTDEQKAEIEKMLNVKKDVKKFDIELFLKELEK